MTEFIKILLSLSLSGTLLMLLVLLPKPLYRERFSRRWQYYIWVVVALRFVLPFTPENTLTGYLFTRMEAATLPDNSENVPAAVVPAAVSGAENDVPVLNRYPESRSSHTDAGALTAGSAAMHTSETQADDHTADTMSFPDGTSRKLPRPGTCLFVIWLTVTMILLVRKVTVYQSFLSFLKSGGTQVSDIEILNLLAECQERLGVRGRVELCTNPMIASPVMVGFFRPCILLPTEEKPENETPCASLCKAFDQTESKREARKQTASMNRELSRENLYYIFTHELIHYKRQDMLYKWFVQLVLCVHWFNPFVYRLAREMNKACELACDEAVTASLDDAGKRAYGNTLLAFLRTDNTCSTSVPYVTLTEGAKDMKERLGTIMKSRKKSKCMSYITAMVTLIICISFTALGAYAKSGSNTLPKNASSKTSSSPAPKNTSPGDVSGSNGSNSENDSSSASMTSSSCEYDNGVYYIYIDGADLSNKPVTGFTDGTIGVVLVQKDGYTSLGPFDVTKADNFREQFTQTCEDMVKDNILTRENADILLSFAEDIVQNSHIRMEKLNLSIVHESAEIRFYENGSPYLHYVLTNYTEQTITETEYCLLAYNADGQPLKLKWDFMDSSSAPAYSHMVRTGGLKILPGQTEDYQGGWSLEDADATEMAYNILCLKTVTFEDGTVWNNPEYESWYQTYAGKEINVLNLATYYPHVYTVNPT